MNASPAAAYEICIKGHLDSRRVDWLNGLTVSQTPDGVTTLMTAPIDQAALFGLLSRIRDLGVLLISVRRQEPAPSPEQQ